MSEIRHDAKGATASQVLAGGARIGRHRHDQHQIVYPSSGAAEVRTEGGSWIAPADRAIWIPAGYWHEHSFYGPTRFHCVGFAPDPMPGRGAPAVIAAHPLLRELIITCSDPGDLPEAEVLRLRQVLLDRIARSPDQSLPLPVARDDRLRRACRLVEDDLATSRPLADLGRAVGASERTLTRLFRTEFAMTYPQWRTRLRLHRAVRLLAEGETVTAAAHHCGWASPSAFIDAYRRVLGRTPGDRRGGLDPSM
ncbi:AraC family transcriptional regulator [Nocardia jejuensis]|uniref:AraC family transcriptional regulator n=1 Tax=Nocardia jejuensis TaxID=328049 RepID=UPI00082EF2D3|nr:helix-turn-helix transcriptional regulator [Nocardia jejuensis]